MRRRSRFRIRVCLDSASAGRASGAQAGAGAAGLGDAAARGGREIINNERLLQAEAHIKVGAPQGPCSSLRLGHRYIPGANKVI